MNKKVSIIAGAVILLLLGGGVFFVTLRNATVACLATNDSPNLAIPSEDQTHIVNTVMVQKTEVTAGAKVDVNVKTYDGTIATGSSVYPENDGSYNFTVKKGSTSNDYQGGWQVTSFTACKG